MDEGGCNVRNFWKDKKTCDFPYDSDDVVKAYFLAIHRWLEELRVSLVEINADHIYECVERIDELAERGYKYIDDPIDPNKSYREGTD